MSEEARPRLKVALVGPLPENPSGWQAMLIDRLAKEERLELVGIIGGAESRAEVKLPWIAELLFGAEQSVWKRLARPYDTKAARDTMAGLPRLNSGNGGTLADVALALTCARMSTSDLAALRFGEWSLSFAGATDPDAGALLSGLANAPLTTVEIVSNAAGAEGPVLVARTAYNPKPVAALNADFISEKSVSFIMKSLVEAHRDQSIPRSGEAPTDVQAPPGGASALAYAVNVSSAISRRLINRASERYGFGDRFWRLAIGSGSIENLDPASAIEVPRVRFTMADPFLFADQGEVYVFFEAQDHPLDPGWIDVGRFDGTDFVPLGVALKRDYHLSYPFVFRDGEDVFMMPETQAADRLEIWRATKFPFEWELWSTAFEGEKLADSMLFKHEGKWWLFTNLSNAYTFQEHTSELHLFSVSGPDLSFVRPHPMNPVIVGSAEARNAGPIITSGNRIFRPSQINSHGNYGYGLNVMEIDRLDETHYEEHVASRFIGNEIRNYIGIHHVSFAEGRYVVDLCGRHSIFTGSEAGFGRASQG